MKAEIANIGVMVATNTALFTALDLGQWLADTLHLWMFPANVVAATIATALGITLTAASRALGLANDQ